MGRAVLRPLFGSQSLAAVRRSSAYCNLVSIHSAARPIKRGNSGPGQKMARLGIVPDAALYELVDAVQELSRAYAALPAWPPAKD